MKLLKMQSGDWKGWRRATKKTSIFETNLRCPNNFCFLISNYWTSLLPNFLRNVNCSIRRNAAKENSQLDLWYIPLATETKYKARALFKRENTNARRTLSGNVRCYQTKISNTSWYRYRHWCLWWRLLYFFRRTAKEQFGHGFRTKPYSFRTGY